MDNNHIVGSASSAHSNQTNSPSQDAGLVSKDGYKKISSLKLYIPEKINLDSLLVEKPPNFQFERDCFVYIINLVIDIPSRKRDLLDKIDGYTPINRKYLQKRIHGYKRYIEYLKSQGILIERNVYSPGKYSMGLKISPRYDSKIIPVSITKWTLIKSIVYSHKAYNEELTQEYSYLEKWLNHKITVDYESCVSFLDGLYREELKNPEIKDERLRYNSRLLPLHKLKENQFSFYVDNTGYRLHTNFTQMMSQLRKFIKYDGKKLCAVDIKNSQLFLSIGLLDDELFTLNDISNKITNPELINHSNYPIMIVENIKAIKDKSDVILFKTYVSQGKFYEHFGDKLLEEGLIEDVPGSELREIAKEITFSAIYSPNRSIGYNKPMQLFKQLFPNVFKIYSLIKKGSSNHPALSICLQRFEADLVLNDACRRIAEDRPDVFIATLHDSIITTEDNVDYVEKALSNVLRERLGVKPPLKIERWE